MMFCRHFKHGRAGIRYRRDLAAAYADRWWNEAESRLREFRGQLHQLRVPVSLCRQRADELYW